MEARGGRCCSSGGDRGPAIGRLERHTHSSDPDANPTACAHRVNNTPQKLVDCVTKDDLWAHMVKFQQIADANPGADGHPSRNSGSPATRPRPTTWPTS